jgi:hypothetical protein
MRSLQGRLILYIIGGAAAMLLVSGIALDRLVGNHLKAEFDKGLLVKAMALVAFTELDGNLVEFDFVERLMPEYGASAKAEYFQLWLQDNRLLARSPSWRPTPPRTAASLDQPRFGPGAAGRPARQGGLVLLYPAGRRVRSNGTNDSTARLSAEAEDRHGIVAPARAPARDVRVGITVAKDRGPDSFLPRCDVPLPRRSCCWRWVPRCWFTSRCGT